MGKTWNRHLKTYWGASKSLSDVLDELPKLPINSQLRAVQSQSKVAYFRTSTPRLHTDCNYRLPSALTYEHRIPVVIGPFVSSVTKVDGV